jgi:selenocysteine-specific elongation factor
MTSNGSQFSSNVRFFTVSTAGHVDHGKTSLIRALTGIDPDRLKEEKERQMTTDLGFAHLKLGDDLIVGFVDVPGHGKFLKNMLAGVGGIDIALLVVAADEGPMPQTKQHVRILSMLGVDRAVVALTKIDTVDDSEHIEIVEEEIADMLAQHGVTMLRLVPVSSTKSIGLDSLKAALTEELSKLPPRNTKEAAFLPIDRVFSKSGFGTVITGTLVRGKLSTGDQVVVGPDVSAARVRRLESFGQTIDQAGPGQRVACNLVLKDNKSLSRGQVVLGNEIPATKMIVASVIDKPKLIGEKFAEKISSQPVRVYHGTAECHGYLRWAQSLTDPADSSGDGAGDNENRALVLIALDDPAVAQAQDRFILRMSDETIYGGIVLLRDRPRWMKRPELLAVANFVLTHDFKQAVLSFIESAPMQILRQSQLSLLLPHPLDKQVLDQLRGENKLVLLGETVMAPQTRALLTARLLEATDHVVKSEIGGDADAETAPLEAVRLRLSPKLDRATFQVLIDEDSQAGKIIRRADKLQVPGKAQKTADPAALKLQEDILLALENSFCLDIDELSKQCAGADPKKIKSMLSVMAKQSPAQLHLINYEFAISDVNLLKAHRALADIWNIKRNIAPTDFKEQLNVTRKYAMALLQHFDDQKITRRLNDGRVLLKPPKP